MTQKKDKIIEPEKILAAVCGLYCEACSVYISTKEDPERLAKIAKTFNITPKEAQCRGCRSDKRLPYCRECKMFACAAQKGIDFCSQCDDYPCPELVRFQSERPHRIELWVSLERVKSEGVSKWLKEMRQHYACPECGTLNSAYDAKCRNCGREPSCEYLAKHKNTIKSFFKTR